MTLFDDRLAGEILGLLRQQHQELGAALGIQPSDQAKIAETQDLPLRHDIDLLIGVANGRHMRELATLRRVEQALGWLLSLLLGNALRAPTRLPDGFWQTEIGILVSRVRWWLSSDDLITISNAAALAFGANTQANRMRIARAIDSGILEWIPDPSVANPQQNRRVLRSQVERLRDLRGLPE